MSFDDDDDDGGGGGASVALDDGLEDAQDLDNVVNGDTNDTFTCYENYTVYYPLYERAQFWIEGTLYFKA